MQIANSTIQFLDNFHVKISKLNVLGVVLLFSFSCSCWTSVAVHCSLEGSYLLLFLLEVPKILVID